MLSRSILAVLVAVAFMSVPSFAQNGQWHVTGGTLAGKAVPNSVCETMTLSINGSTFTAKSGNKSSTGTVTINQNAEPYQTMVFKITGGDDNGREIKAIYLTVPNGLQIAFSKDSNFPGVLRSTTSNKLLLLSYSSGQRQSVASSGRTNQNPIGAGTTNTQDQDSGNGAAAGIN